LFQIEDRSEKRIIVTVTLHLKPEVEAGLLERARARGMGLEEYLLSLVEEASRNRSREADWAASDRENAVRRMLEFGDKHRLSLGQQVTREMLHEGHRV